METFMKHIQKDAQDFVLFTGSVPPKKRQELWESSRFIFSTPQTLENDVLAKRIELDEVSLIVFDEAHRATGDYAYVFLAGEYQKHSRHPRILALTASPGTDETKIKEVMTNLCTQKIEYRKSSDPDVKDFTQETEVQWLQVELPKDFLQAAAYLKRAYSSRLQQVRTHGYLSEKYMSLSKMQLLKLQKELHLQAQQEYVPELLQSISLLAQALKIQHALELLETQCLQACKQYIASLMQQARTSKVKAYKQLAQDVDVISAFAKTRDLLAAGIEHPKLTLLVAQVREILQKKPSAKVIIFSQFRDSAMAIAQLLAKHEISQSIFFGQAKKNGVGFSQKKQKEVLDQFRSNEFSCLIATSVAEEGLDIPTVDHVFFYEPVPSAIRTVQRRGRTGRHEKGFVSVLMTKNTRDETYRWVAFHKERRMYGVLEKLKNSPQLQQAAQRSLQQFTQPKEEPTCTVIIDHREKGSPVMKALRNLNVHIELQQLSIGDYVVGPEACIEYKRYDDFLDSIADGRLIAQLHQLKKYAKPVILLEKGDASNTMRRRIDESAIQGMLATIAVSYRIPILQSSSPLDSAQLLLALARREQEGSSSSFSFHNAKPYSDKELLEYIVSSFPGTGGVLAKNLLKKFDTLERLFQASLEELQEIDKIGPKKAKEIKRMLSLSYTRAKKEQGLDES
jgi:Fanconi anemia group M protein